ncbi:MAG: hypothetical protein ABSH49_01100 [Bryobacteraceae bacterium]|jgi:hypothetical protein
MNDGELRGIILRYFYEARNYPGMLNILGVPDVANLVEHQFRIVSICRQLAEHGLIHWEDFGSLNTFGGEGRITACGVDVVEGTAQPPITVILHDHSISVMQSSNVQIGDSNTISHATGLPWADLARLVSDLTMHLDELSLDARQKQRAAAQIATLRAELVGDPDPTVVRQASRTLRNIIEGAIGSLVATAAQPAVWHWIQQALATLSS